MENNNELERQKDNKVETPGSRNRESAFTPLERRLLKRKRCYKKRITRKKKRKVMDRDGSKTTQDLKNKAVLNRCEMKPLSIQHSYLISVSQLSHL